MIDGNAADVIEEDADSFMSRRFGAGQIPLRDLGGPEAIFEVLPPVSPLVPYQAPMSPFPPRPAQGPRAFTAEPERLTLASVLAGWWQWALWKIQAPRIPLATEPAMPAPDPAPAAEAVAAPAAPPEAEPLAAAYPESVCLEDIAARAAERVLDAEALRNRLNEMIREELQGEMGARFSSNIRAVIRREVASAVDDRH